VEIPHYTPRPLNHYTLMEYAEELSEAYPFLGIEYIGESILGKRICAFVMGEGKTELLYISGHHGAEWITGLALIRFVYELCEAYEAKRKVYGADTRFLLKEKRFVIIPLLNPDGAEIQQNGISTDNPLYERVMKMNNGSSDFSAWQANARGVDLNHNYNAGWMEYKAIEQENGIETGAPTKYSGPCAESEPECGAVCAYIRGHNFRSLLSLHTQGEEIYYSSLGCCPSGARVIAKKISAITGYRLSAPSGTAAYGGLLDWFIQEYGLPAFTLECGKGQNPLPLCDEQGIYMHLRKLLFTFPLMV